MSLHNNHSIYCCKLHYNSFSSLKSLISLYLFKQTAKATSFLYYVKITSLCVTCAIILDIYFLKLGNPSMVLSRSGWLVPLGQDFRSAVDGDSYETFMFIKYNVRKRTFSCIWTLYLQNTSINTNVEILTQVLNTYFTVSFSHLCPQLVLSRILTLMES